MRGLVESYCGHLPWPHHCTSYRQTPSTAVWLIRWCKSCFFAIKFFQNADGHLAHFNLFLRLQELATTREQCTTQKRKISRLEDTIRQLEGRKKFDATKAFKHSKENLAPLHSPKGKRSQSADKILVLHCVCEKKDSLFLLRDVILCCMFWTESRKKLEAGKAFKHSRENLVPVSSPLRDGRRLLCYLFFKMLRWTAFCAVPLHAFVYIALLQTAGCVRLGLQRILILFRCIFACAYWFYLFE